MQTWENNQSTPKWHMFINLGWQTHTRLELGDVIFYLLWDWVIDLRGNQGGGSLSSSDQA